MGDRLAPGGEVSMLWIKSPLGSFHFRTLSAPHEVRVPSVWCSTRPRTGRLCLVRRVSAFPAFRSQKNMNASAPPETSCGSPPCEVKDRTESECPTNVPTATGSLTSQIFTAWSRPPREKDVVDLGVARDAMHGAFVPKKLSDDFVALQVPTFS